MFLCHEEEKVGQQHLATWGVQRPCKRCVELKAGDDFDKSSEDRINGKESPPLPVFLTFKYRKIPSANQMLGEISMVKAVWLGSSVTASSCRKVQLMAILKNPCGSTGHEVPIWNLPEVAPSSAWNICQVYFCKEQCRPGKAGRHRHKNTPLSYKKQSYSAQSLL